MLRAELIEVSRQILEDNDSFSTERKQMETDRAAFGLRIQ